ncbi:hypothetical protein [Brevundimonas sp.]|uniref:hypothetical protein n=1 Tax=Brevundimonas sp. TaxID=1871086 RepID=UPI0025BF7DE7|nr:hypothetical protein [Brevundimonas sp.]
MTDPMELVERAGASLRDENFTASDASFLIEDLAACIRDLVEWRPIETAPKDGTVIHVFSPGFDWPEAVMWEFYPPEVVIDVGADGYWTYAEGLMAHVMESCEPETWTLWKPIALPTPPSKADRGGA